MRILNIIAWALVIIGAVNWGLVGAFDFNLVSAIFGSNTALAARIVYILVGLAGLYCLALYPLISQEYDKEEALVTEPRYTPT
jgi:uncharacterized protein